MNQGIRLYFRAGRGEGGGWERVQGGGGGVFGTLLLFNSHESTEVTIAITAHIGAPIAGQLWQLWNLAWDVTA